MSRIAVLAALLFPMLAVAELPLAARAILKNAKGSTVGTALLVAEEGGVSVLLQVHDLPAGKHAFHVHSVGKRPSAPREAPSSARKAPRSSSTRSRTTR